VTGVWLMIVSLAVATTVLKLIGPLLLGGRPLPSGATAIIELLASALLAALVVVETFGKGHSLTLDARAPGVAFAAIALSRRVPVIVAVVGAAAVTALFRALS
jgi:dihydrodipicolinate synthase/N-acetylneuraminate lyase